MPRRIRERVSELVVRGIYTLTTAELDWYYQFGVSEMFPDKWERFIAPIPEAERGDMMAAYRKRLTGSDREAQVEARPRLEPVGRRDDHAAARPRDLGHVRRGRLRASPSPASRTTFSSMPAGWRRGS